MSQTGKSDRIDRRLSKKTAPKSRELFVLFIFRLVRRHVPRTARCFPEAATSHRNQKPALKALIRSQTRHWGAPDNRDGRYILIGRGRNSDIRVFPKSSDAI